MTVIQNGPDLANGSRKFFVGLVESWKYKFIFKVKTDFKNLNGSLHVSVVKYPKDIHHGCHTECFRNTQHNFRNEFLIC